MTRGGLQRHKKKFIVLDFPTFMFKVIGLLQRIIVRTNCKISLRKNCVGISVFSVTKDNSEILTSGSETLLVRLLCNFKAL
jgi:hypothetical protein